MKVVPTQLSGVLIAEPLAYPDDGGFLCGAENERAFDRAIGYPVSFGHRPLHLAKTGSPTWATRPAYSVLGSTRRAEKGISDLRHWQESLPTVVESLIANGVVTLS